VTTITHPFPDRGHGTPVPLCLYSIILFENVRVYFFPDYFYVLHHERCFVVDPAHLTLKVFSLLVIPQPELRQLRFSYLEAVPGGVDLFKLRNDLILDFFILFDDAVDFLEHRLIFLVRLHFQEAFFRFL